MNEHPPNCHGDGHLHGEADAETPCPKSDDGMHCEHWYDAEECHYCRDPGLPLCPACVAEGVIEQ